MIPKSTAKLKTGDYCLLPRADGTSVIFAYLDSVSGSRSALYGALLSPPMLAKDSALPLQVRIAYKGLVHISSYAENNTPIVGNVADLIGDSQIKEALSACTDTSIGAVHAVIGHRALLRKAESVAA